MIKLKRTVTLLLAVTLIFGAMAMISCKKDGDGDTDPPIPAPSEGFNPYPYPSLDVYMELPEYKGVKMSNALLEKMMKAELASFYRRKGIDNVLYEGAAVKYDNVDITYTGYIDGVTFNGGSAEGYMLLLGSGSFIDGFEDGVIGMQVGDTKDISLTFPDNYGYTEYAGKAVIFRVTLNRIYRAPTLTNELVSANTVYSTPEEFLAAVKHNCAFDYAWEQLLSVCQIKKYPDEYTEYYTYFKSYFQSLATDMGISIEQFLATYGNQYSAYGLYSGMTPMEFEALATNYAKSNLVNDLLTYSIMRAEDIKTEGAEYEEAARQLEKEYGTTYAKLVETYGEREVIISIINIRISRIIVDSIIFEN